jgi:4-amino-4-deoxy-L-arabinose transferase-like glycosyltransferase
LSLSQVFRRGPGRLRWPIRPALELSCHRCSRPGASTSLSCQLSWIVLLAFAARSSVRLYSGASDFWENGYGFFFVLAQRIASGDGVSAGQGPTAFRVPLYPAFLAAVTFGHQAFLPILIAQSLIGAGTVLCAALIARELFGHTAAVIAAFLTAIYPYYVVHDTALQETSLCTFLMALAVFLLLRTRRSGSALIATSAGLTLGVSVLTRANLAPFALFAPFWLALAGGSRAASWGRRLLVAVICAGVGIVTVAPWLIRAYQLTGSITLSTQSGFFLWQGNNAYTFSHYPRESIDISQATALAALSPEERSELEARQGNEALVDDWFHKKGLDYIREHPWQTLSNDLQKVLDVFGWLPSPRRGFWPSLVHALSYGFIMILGLLGMWTGRRHWREHSILYAQFVTFAAVTAVFIGHTSYRAYIDVYLIIFAAGILATWLSKLALSKLDSTAN